MSWSWRSRRCITGVLACSSALVLSATTPSVAVGAQQVSVPVGGHCIDNAGGDGCGGGLAAGHLPGRDNYLTAAVLGTIPEDFVPPGAVLESAILRLYSYNGNGELGAFRTVGPLPSSTYAHDFGEHLVGPVDTVAVAQEGWNAWDVTATVREWLSGAVSNDGIALFGEDGWARFEDGSGSSATAPHLEVTYDVPPDVAAPGVDAAGDIVDLADDYTNGQSSVPAVVAADDDQQGIAHLGVSEVGGAELGGGVDLDCGTPRRCPLDVDEGFDVDLSSLGAGRRVLQATARDDSGKVGVSEPWPVYIDRQASGAVTNVEASKIDAEPAQVYWTEPPDPALPDGSPGSGTTDFSYRYRVNSAAWSSWEQSDVSGIIVSGAATGSTIEVQVSSIDAVGNMGPLTIATVTVTAEDGSDAAEAAVAGPTDTDTGATAQGTVAADDEVYPPGANKPTAGMFCDFGPGMGQRRLGRGRFDIQNAMLLFGTIRCWNNATTPRSAAKVARSKYRWRICLTVPRPIPLLPIELGCRTTESRASAIPGAVIDTEIKQIKELCVAGSRRYAVTASTKLFGPLRDSSTGPLAPGLFRTVWDCNEAGAWRYLARRGSGSASFQLGNNITAPRCSGERCDSLPEHGTSDPRRGWQAHHIVPGGEGRSFENNTTAQASRAQTYAYSCNQRPNEPPNGAWLRGSDLRSPKPGYLALNQAERDRPIHSRIHTIGYYETVADRLDPFVNADDTCADNDGVVAELQEIKREVIFGNFSGLPAASKVP